MLYKSPSSHRGTVTPLGGMWCLDMDLMKWRKIEQSAWHQSVLPTPRFHHQMIVLNSNLDSNHNFENNNNLQRKENDSRSTIIPRTRTMIFIHGGQMMVNEFTQELPDDVSVQVLVDQ
eukprot:gb/GECH01007074.1/.p1 GENE.gb/GECH01007074.1/~~gb/GECH01007074.1/.p1  ORF type:complete len:118 (+),score=32.38 gb/GECH01007074.1/:1-354(+)